MGQETKNGQPAVPAGSGWARSFRAGLVLAGALAVEGTLAFWVWRPLHAAGGAQPVTGLLNALDPLLQLPGMLAAELVGIRTEHQSTAAAWAFALLVNSGLYFLIGVYASRRWRRRSVPPASAEPGAPPVSRRR